MTPDILKTLQQVNRTLRSALIQLRPEQRHCSTIQPQDFSDLLAEILRAADCLRRQPLDREPTEAVQQASLDYRTNLEELRDFLPQLHGNLLAEKSRLEAEQTQLTAAAAWARTSTGTL